MPVSDEAMRVTSRQVVRRLCTDMAEAGLDALVCVSPENVAYVLGFVVPSQPLMRWRHVAVVLTADGREAAVCVDMEAATVRARRPELEVRAWEEFTGSAMGALASLLSDFDLTEREIGIELGYLSVADHSELTSLLPDARFAAADALLAMARRLKTADEVDLLERLSRIADRSIATTFAEAKAGSSEMDLAASLTRSIYAQGAEQFRLMIVASGERSQEPNVGPSQRVLEAGDVCRVEIFPVIDGYHAGVCRTAVVGDPPAEAERIYANLVECRRSVLDVIAPGVPARVVYEQFRSKFDELGLPPISFVGHGVGVDLHEEPYLGPFSDVILLPSMVLAIEPLVYRSGYGFGMQIKDMVVVEPDGCRLISDVSEVESLCRIAG